MPCSSVTEFDDSKAMWRDAGTDDQAFWLQAGRQIHPILAAQGHVAPYNWAVYPRAPKPVTAAFPHTRPRRLRTAEFIRALVRETRLAPAQLI